MILTMLMLALAIPEQIVTRDDEIWISCRERCVIHYELIEGESGKDVVDENWRILHRYEVLWVEPAATALPFAGVFRIEVYELPHLRDILFELNPNPELLIYRVIHYTPTEP